MKRIIYSALVALSILFSVSACTEEPIKPSAASSLGTHGSTGEVK